MSILRVDDRLIHGQVSVGWVRRLKIKRIVLANDAVAEDPLERRLYEQAVPAGVEVEILPLKAVAGFLASNSDPNSTMVLVKELKDALKLLQYGIEVEAINIGGLHFQPGKRPITPYIHVDSQDLECMRKILEYGVRLEGREVPDGPMVDLGALLWRWSR